MRVSYGKSFVVISRGLFNRVYRGRTKKWKERNSNYELSFACVAVRVRKVKNEVNDGSYIHCFV